jgi:hypothetical protein
MKKSLLVLFALAFALASNCAAGPIVYAITDIATFESYTSTDTSQTFAGTGFVGMYTDNDEETTASWAHLLGLEHTDYSRTILEVDISGLAGVTINSAILSFQLLDGFASDHGILATSYTADGNLAYSWDAPNDLGHVAGAVNSGANSLDVTSLVAAQVAAGSSWFGLLLQGTDSDYYVWTYTGANYGADRADMRLTINGASAVPEPGTCALAAGALLALAGWVRRRKA